MKAQEFSAETKSIYTAAELFIRFMRFLISGIAACFFFVFDVITRASVLAIKVIEKGAKAWFGLLLSERENNTKLYKTLCIVYFIMTALAIWFIIRRSGI